MASVTSMTAERIMQLMNDQVVSGSIGSNGHLILKTKGGEERDAGVVVDPLAAWPIGSIFIGTTATNPTTLLGGGTWARWGQGRIPISLNESDAAMNTPEEVGGSKTKVIGTANLPPHNHNMTHDHASSKLSYNWQQDVASGGSYARVTDIGNQTVGGGKSETIEINNFQYSGNTGDGPGSSDPLDIMPPYITAYMWKRTA